MGALDHLEEVLRLISETGDRCIMLHQNFEPYVIMNMRSYRSLLEAAARKQDVSNLSERELLDKINQQIAEWREFRQEEMSAYDILQFRAGQPSGPQSKTKTDIISSAKYPQEVQAPKYKGQPASNLPIVEEDNELDEYKLEPLA